MGDLRGGTMRIAFMNRDDLLANNSADFEWENEKPRAIVAADCNRADTVYGGMLEVDRGNDRRS